MKSEICKNCTHYSAYYWQRSDGFGRLSKGFCSKQQKPQTQYENCEEYKGNELKEKSREKRRMKSLDEALKAIIEIAQILREKENEKK